MDILSKMKKIQIVGNWFSIVLSLCGIPGQNFLNRSGNEFTRILGWIKPLITPNLAS